MTPILITSLHQPTLAQQRARWDVSRIRYFTQHPDEIRDVVVYQNPVGAERILANGRHRVEAARRLGWSRIDADLRPGTRQDALLYRDLAQRRPWSQIDHDAGASPPSG